MKEEILKKIKQTLPATSLFLILVVCMGLWLIFSINGNQTRDVYGENGVWDLRHINFSETIVRIQGLAEEIEFGTLNVDENSDFEEIFWLDEEKVTRRIRLYFPDEGWYMFRGLTFSSAHRLCVNGQWILEKEDKEILEPHTSHIVFTAKAVDGVVEIIQQTHVGTLYQDIEYQYWYVGNQNLLSHLRTMTFVSSLVASCFLALFLIYMILYLLQREYLTNLYFSLFSLTLFLRAGITEVGIISAIIPWLNLYVKYRLEYVTIPAIACFLVAMVHELLPGIVSRAYRISVYLLSVVFAIIFLFVDITLMSQMMMAGYLLYFIAIVYGILSGVIVVIKSQRKLYFEQYILLVGFLLVLVAILNDFNRHSRIQLLPEMPSMSVMASVYFCFCMLAAVLISNKKATDAIKQAEQELALEVATLAQLNRMKIELMATLSHEARTPLAVLASYSGLVAMELKNSEGNDQMIANLDKIVAESKRVANLIDSMNKIVLNEGCIEEKRKVDLSELIEQAAKLYCHMFEQEGIELKLDLDDKLFTCANAEKLNQVLFNLFQNAKEHTEKGQVSIHAMVENDAVVVEIADTGTGIPSDLLPFVFERGVSGSEFGSGIGLAVCKEIIDEHEGTIRIDSEVTGIRKGTKVTFALPIVKDEDGKDGSV